MKAIVLFITVVSLFSVNVSGQTFEEVLKAVASDRAIDDEFGTSVAIDGNYVLIGAHFDNSNGRKVGQAYLFNAASGRLLHTFGDPTVSSPGDQFGHTVAIDGNYVLIGAPFDATGGLFVGQAFLFDAATGKLLETLNDPTPTTADKFGSSVAIDAR